MGCLMQTGRMHDDGALVCSEVCLPSLAPRVLLSLFFSFSFCHGLSTTSFFSFVMFMIVMAMTDTNYTHGVLVGFAMMAQRSFGLWVLHIRAGYMGKKNYTSFSD